MVKLSWKTDTSFVPNSEFHFRSTHGNCKCLDGSILPCSICPNPRTGPKNKEWQIEHGRINNEESCDSRNIFLSSLPEQLSDHLDSNHLFAKDGIHLKPSGSWLLSKWIGKIMFRRRAQRYIPTPLPLSNRFGIFEGETDDSDDDYDNDDNYSSTLLSAPASNKNNRQVRKKKGPTMKCNFNSESFESTSDKSCVSPDKSSTTSSAMRLKKYLISRVSSVQQTRQQTQQHVQHPAVELGNHHHHPPPPPPAVEVNNHPDVQVIHAPPALIYEHSERTRFGFERGVSKGVNKGVDKRKDKGVGNVKKGVGSKLWLTNKLRTQNKIKLAKAKNTVVSFSKLVKNSTMLKKLLKMFPKQNYLWCKYNSNEKCLKKERKKKQKLEWKTITINSDFTVPSEPIKSDKSQSMFQVFLKSCFNEIITFDIKCTPEIQPTIFHLKHRVSQVTGVPQSKFILTIHSQPISLNDSCLIYKQETLEMHVQGGGIKGGSGRGRPSASHDFHPEKEKCGPCYLCKDNSVTTRYFHFPLKDDLFYQWVRHEKGIQNQHCICQKCRIKLNKEYINIPNSLNTSVEEPKKKISALPCILQHFNKCTELSKRSVKDNEISFFAKCFDVDERVLAEKQEVHICNLHHLSLVNYIRDNTQSCTFCKNPLTSSELNHLRSCPDYISVIGYLKREGTPIPQSFTENSLICGKCYTEQWKKINKSDSLSTMYKLRMNVEERKKKDFIQNYENVSDFHLNKILIFLIDNILLKDCGILLQDLYETFQQYQNTHSEMIGAVSSEENAGALNKNSHWLFTRVQAEIGEFIDYHQVSRKSGTVLFRVGTNFTNALSHALVQSRFMRIKHEKQINNLTSTIDCLRDQHELKLEYCIEVVVKSLNEKLYSQAKELMEKYGSVLGSENGDLRQFDLNKFVEEMDPVLWNTIFLLTANKSERDILSSNSNCGFDWTNHFTGFGISSISRAETRKLRCMFILCCMLFSVSHGECSRPFHLLVAETVFSQSGSKTLLNILNRLGASASYDTLKRYIVEVVNTLQTEGIPGLLEPHSFASASVDNVDRLFRFAACRAGEKVKIMNATSYQAVIPKPSFTLDISSTAPLVRDKIPTNSDSIKIINICGDGNCFFRAIAVGVLPELKSNSCARNIGGEAIDPRLSQLESEIAKALRKETMNTILDNIDYFLELDPGILQALCYKNNGQSYESFYDRCVCLLQNPSEYAGQPEAMAVSYAARCPIQIFRKIDGKFTKIQSFGEDCFSNAAPIKLLYHLDTDDKPGHYDLLVENDTQNVYDKVYSNCHKNKSSIFTEWSKLNYTGDDASYFPKLVNELHGNVRETTFTAPNPTKHSRRLDEENIMPNSEPYKDIYTSESEKEKELKSEQFSLSESEIIEIMKLRKRLFFYTLKKHAIHKINPPSLCIPSFKVKFSQEDEAEIEKSKVFYLGCLNLHADCRDTILKVLDKLSSIFKVGINIKKLVVVGDAKTYVLLQTLKSEYGCELDWLIPYPGDWHLLFNYQPALFQPYMEAGLKDIASSTHQGKTLQSIISGTNFKKTHKFIIQSWEALFRLQLDIFFKWREGGISSLKCNENPKDILETIINTIMAENELLCENEEATEFSDDDDKVLHQQMQNLQTELQTRLQGIHDDFEHFLEILTENDELWKLWNQFIHFDAFYYISLWLSIRQGNWSLRNASLKGMGPIFHAFDRTYYLKLVPQHLADMLRCPKDIIKMFENGGFVVSITGTHWSAVALDEAHEMLINKDIKGCLVRASQEYLSRITPFLTYQAELVRNFKDQIMPQYFTPYQKDSHNSIVVQEEKNVRFYLTKFQKCHLSSPSFEKKKKLTHLFNEQSLTEEIIYDMLHFRKIGEKDILSYIKTFHLTSAPKSKTPRKKRNLKTFNCKKNLKTRNEKKILADRDKVEQCLRSKIYFSKEKGCPIQTVEQYNELPRAIANVDGSMYKSAKSTATTALNKCYSGCFIEVLPSWSPQTIIIDGMFIIQSEPLGTHKSFKDYACFLINRWIRPFFNKGAKEIHILFDHPNRHGISPKDLERHRRDSTDPTTTQSNNIKSEDAVPRDWRKFLDNRSQKRLLANFLSSYFLENTPLIMSCTEQMFYTAGGFDNDNLDKCLSVSSDGSLHEITTLNSNHEEADSRMWLHALKPNKYQNVLIVSPDTDTYHIGIPLLPKYPQKQVYVQLHLQIVPGKNNFLNVNSLVNKIQNDVSLRSIPEHLRGLLVQIVFIVTGCDFTSSFYGLTKQSFLKSLSTYCHFITGSHHEGQLFNFQQNQALSFHSFLRLIGCVYFDKYKSAFSEQTPEVLFNTTKSNSSQLDTIQILSAWMANIREKVWSRSQGEQNYIPSVDALKFHWLRCCWVLQMWSQADQQLVVLAELSEYGWQINNQILSWIYDSDENISKVQSIVQSLTKGCKCKRGCRTLQCGCRKSKTICQPGCRCLNCQNTEQSSTDHAHLNDQLNQGNSLMADATDSDDSTFSAESDTETDEENINEYLPPTSNEDLVEQIFGLDDFEFEDF